MRIDVKVIPRAKSNSVICGDDGIYVVRTTAVPVDGSANAVVQKMLAKHFHVAKSCVRIVRGAQSRVKIVDIMV